MMAGSHDKRNSLRRLAAFLALAALTLRALVAPGLMPDLAAAAEGELRLVICAGTGVKTLDSLTGEAPSEGAPAGEICPFAALAYAATLPDPGAAPGAPDGHRIEPPAPQSGPLAQAAAALRARGPPHFRS